MLTTRQHGQARRLLPRCPPSYDSRIHGYDEIGKIESHAISKSDRAEASEALPCSGHEFFARRQATRPKSMRPPCNRSPSYVSPLQSDTKRRHYRVPDWAGAITQDGSERAVLSVVHYWLAPAHGSSGTRARGSFLYVDEIDYRWYVVTARQLAKQIFGSVHQVRRAIRRLSKLELIINETHTVAGRNVGVRLRLNWAAIEVAVSEVWGTGEEEE